MAAGGAGGREVGRISIRVVPKLVGFRRKIKEELEAVERELKGDVEVKAHLDGNEAKVDMRRLMAELKAKAADGVTIKTKLERSNLDRVENALGGIGRKFQGLFGGGGGAGNLQRGGGFGLGGFADSLAVVVAVAAVAAPALALISGALVSLPAIAAAAITPIGAIALGLDGIKAAAAQLGPDLDALKKRLSDTFEGRLTPIFGQLKQVFPALEETLPIVANGISDVAQSLTDVVTSQPGMQAIKGTIGNIGETISRSAPGVGKWTEGLLKLADRVSAKFPGVADKIGEIGESFLGWVDKISSDGSLDAAMKNFGDTMGPLLGIVKDLAAQGFEWLKDPEFGKSMTQFAESLRGFVDNVLPELGTFFMQVSDLAAAIDKLTSWKPPEWIAGNKQEQEQNIVPGSGDGPFNKGRIKGSLIDKIYEFFHNPDNKFLGEGPDFSGWWEGMKAPFVTAWENIKQTVSTGSAVMGQQMSGIWEGVKNAAAGALAGMFTIVNNVASNIGNAFSAVPGTVSSVLSSIPGIAAGIFNSMVGTVAGVVAQIIPVFVNVGSGIMAEVGSWPGKIVGALGNLGGLLVGAGQALMSGLLSGIKAGLQAVLDFASTIAGKIAAVKGPIPKDRKELTPAGLALMQGLQDGIETGTQPVLDKARALAEEIANAVNNGLQGVDTEGLHDRLKQTMDEIDIRRKELKVDYDGIDPTDKEARKGNQAQRKQLQDLRDQLSLQDERLGYSQKYGESEKENNETLKKGVTTLIDGISNFAMANGQQLAQDLGIGGGAISNLAGEGVNYLTSMLGNLASGALGGGTTIQVNSVDEAVAAKSRIAAQEAIQYYRR